MTQLTACNLAVPSRPTHPTDPIPFGQVCHFSEPEIAGLGCGLVVKHLPNMCKALGSIPQKLKYLKFGRFHIKLCLPGSSRKLLAHSCGKLSYS